MWFELYSRWVPLNSAELVTSPRVRGIIQQFNLRLCKKSKETKKSINTDKRIISQLENRSKLRLNNFFSPAYNYLSVYYTWFSPVLSFLLFLGVAFAIFSLKWLVIYIYIYIYIWYIYRSKSSIHIKLKQCNNM